MTTEFNPLRYFISTFDVQLSLKDTTGKKFKVTPDIRPGYIIAKEGATVVSTEALADGGSKLTWSDGTVEYLDSDGRYHRADGPAVTGQWSDGPVEIWALNGTPHRENGPAIKMQGNEYWFICGVHNGFASRVDKEQAGHWGGPALKIDGISVYFENGYPVMLLVPNDYFKGFADLEDGYGGDCSISNPIPKEHRVEGTYACYKCTNGVAVYENWWQQ